MIKSKNGVGMCPLLGEKTTSLFLKEKKPWVSFWNRHVTLYKTLNGPSPSLRGMIFSLKLKLEMFLR